MVLLPNASTRGRMTARRFLVKRTKSARCGETGIRNPDTGLTPYNGLANRRLQPLGHLSGERLNPMLAFTKTQATQSSSLPTPRALGIGRFVRRANAFHDLARQRTFARNLHVRAGVLRVGRADDRRVHAVDAEREPQRQLRPRQVEILRVQFHLLESILVRLPISLV